MPNYRWSASEFIRAWEAGAFDRRVELVDGEIWPVVVGDWHGVRVSDVNAALRRPGVTVTTATLPSGDSLPDPDCWVRRVHAEPAGKVGGKVSTWRPQDVLLVVEVSDETMLADLTTKAQIYGSAGWAVYWVVTPEAIYVHTEPHPAGYANRHEFRPGERVPLPYAKDEVSVDDLLGPATS